MHDASELISSYRHTRNLLLAIIAELFPPGAVVRAKGTTSVEWTGVVLAVGANDRRQTSGDMVSVAWSNGNRYPVRIDEIELDRK
jgi:hypothetical protein